MSSDKSECLILTPTHKEVLDELEVIRLEISLRACNQLPHSFLLKESSNIEFFRSTFPNSGIIKMRDSNFGSRQSYNRLLLSVEFYKQFLPYKYLLILQTDAFVLKDVTKLVARNYSYIGSPWVEPKRIHVIRGRLFEDSKKLRSLKATKITVGNGGLSLRNINDITRVLSNLNAKKRNSILLTGTYNEDIVLSYILKKNDYKLPTETEAKKWFIEKHAKDMDLSMALNHYGFHALSRFNAPLEKQIFNYEMKQS